MGGYHRNRYENTFCVMKAVILRKTRLGLAGIQPARSSDLQTTRLKSAFCPSRLMKPLVCHFTGSQLSLCKCGGSNSTVPPHKGTVRMNTPVTEVLTSHRKLKRNSFAQQGSISKARDGKKGFPAPKSNSGEEQGRHCTSNQPQSKLSFPFTFMKC